MKEGNLMRNLFILMLVANVGVTLVSLVVLPDRVAIHFGADGVANGWASNMVNALLMTGTHALLFGLLYFSPRLVTWLPASCINLPNKDYWLKPANLRQTQEKLQRFMWSFGAVILLFYFIISLLSVRANLVQPVRLNEWAFYTALALFLLFTTGWIMALYRAFRSQEILK
jgi:uncharacterized membrane protein